MHPDLAVEMLSGGSATEGGRRDRRGRARAVRRTGYPEGLRGDAIPIGSRIVALVDAFDSLVGDRRLHQAATIAAANAQLVRSAGTDFDPDVVAAWLRYSDAVLPSGARENERRL